ncbi:MAG: RNA-binding protein [Spirochaetota bacterium]
MQESKLYVGNLSYSVTDEQLRTLFAAHGEVASANVIPGKGFGFVEMGTVESATKAKEALNGQQYEGRTLRIDNARPQKPREERGGDYGGQRY